LNTQPTSAYKVIILIVWELHVRAQQNLLAQLAALYLIFLG
jgi:hypothetical protein